MINKGRISRGVLKVLLKPSKKYGKMPVYDAWYDRNDNNVGELYVHDKVVTINGALGGRNVKITWTGSQNFTALGTLANNDILLRVIDPSVTHAYNVHFAYIRRHYTHRMYNVPWRTRRPNCQGVCSCVDYNAGTNTLFGGSSTGPLDRTISGPTAPLRWRRSRSTGPGAAGRWPAPNGPAADRACAGHRSR